MFYDRRLLRIAPMSNFLPKSIRNLIEEFSKLPGIGPKSAQRLAIHLLHSPEDRVRPLGDAVLKLRENVCFCNDCWNLAESNPCKICGDEKRDKGVICVVEEVLDVVALEKTGEYKGVYHVLHGVLSPVDGVGPDQLKMTELFERVKRDADDNGGGGESALSDADEGESGDSQQGIREIILATNPSLEGEATALYIQKYLRDSGAKITRIARGLPVGGDLEYADEVTLSRAMSGRVEF